MLLSLLHVNGKKVCTYKTTDNAGCIFRRMRKRAAKKFNNPELLKIHFYSEDIGEQQKKDTQKETLMQYSTYLDTAHLPTSKSMHN